MFFESRIIQFGDNMQLKFWGVRGSIATPEAEKLGYGGNTTCLEIRDPEGNILIFDAGTGFRNLGQELLKITTPLELHLFFTHLHLDHTFGIPFFIPIYKPTTDINIYGEPRGGKSFKKILSGQFSKYYSPVSFNIMPSKKTFNDLNGEPVKIGKTTVTHSELNHPDGCKGYRIENRGKSIVIATDHEHFEDRDNENLIELAEDADILIYDCQYTEDEYNNVTKGWGHSTWYEGVKAAKKAKVKTLAMFHHDPYHNDEFVDNLVKMAKKDFPNTFGAKDHMVVEL